MRSSFVALVILVTALIGVARAEPLPRKPVDPQAVEHYTRGARLYGNAAFADAIEEFKASALVQPAPATDFNLGVCYRLLGESTKDQATKKQNYDRAIWHYGRFIKASPQTPALAIEVQKLVDAMRAEIAAMPAPPPPSSNSVPAPSSRPAEPSPPVLVRPDPFYRDPVAWSLTGAGLVTLGVAGGLFWGASSLRDDAAATPDQQEQTSLRDRAHTRSLVGTTLVFVGGGLTLAGIIKLIAHDSEPTRTQSSIQLGVSGDGVMVFGRF